MDPLAFRLKNLSDPRVKAVLQAAADKFGWASGQVHTGAWIRHRLRNGKRRLRRHMRRGDNRSRNQTSQIRRVVEAWESGAIVNPDGLRNQMQGAIVQAIGGALFERILFGNGRIQNPLFSKYRVPRFSDTPQVEIVLLDRKDLPSAGAGETGLVGLAPAVGNAIFAATGVRLRSMPMTPDNKRVRA